MLEGQRPFDGEAVALLDAFLGRLAPPVCLLAHNGHKFDFPLLAKQMAKLGQVFFVLLFTP